MARRVKRQRGLTQISRTARSHANQSPVPSCVPISRPRRMTPELSESDAARFRAFERTRYHALAGSYDNFFTPVTTNAIAPLLKAAHLKAGDKLLDVRSEERRVGKGC